MSPFVETQHILSQSLEQLPNANCLEIVYNMVLIAAYLKYIMRDVGIKNVLCVHIWQLQVEN